MTPIDHTGPAGGASRNRGPFWFVLLRIPELLLALLITVLIVFLTGSVVSRYLFDVGLAWSDEAARLLFVWTVFLGFAVGVRHRANIGVDLFVDRLSPGARRRINVLQDTAILLFSAVFTWQSMDAVRFSMLQRLPALEITIAWMYGATLVAGALMTIYAIANLVEGLSSSRVPDRTGEAAVAHAE